LSSIKVSKGLAINTGAKKVVTNSVTLAKASKSSSSDSRSKASSLSTKLLNEMIPSGLKQEVLKEMAGVMPTFLTELTVSCTPFVGVIFSGGSAVVSGGKLAHAVYKQERVVMHASRTLSTEEPEAAFKALIRMMDRESNQKAENFAKGLADFGSKLASTLADGGTVTNAAIGLASGLVKLLMILRIVVRDVLERNAANKLLQKPVITVDLFIANPLMGAYFICCLPTSVLVNVMLDSENFNKPGMMDKIEHAVRKHHKPLQAKARSLICDHRMYFPELQNFPALLKKNKKSLKAMMKAKGKTNMRGFGPDDFDDEGQLQLNAAPLLQ